MESESQLKVGFLFTKEFAPLLDELIPLLKQRCPDLCIVAQVSVDTNSPQSDNSSTGRSAAGYIVNDNDKVPALFWPVR